MLRSRPIVAFLWFLVVISALSAEEFKTPDEIAEIQLGVKTAFAKQAREISDLLHMFIALINRADEAEGRELGLPEITTTSPINLESASLEELFDRFETAAQSFRTRFLKYLKTTENSITTPTISTVVELNNGEDLTKYVYVHENDDVVESDPNSGTENEYSATIIDRDVTDSSEKTTLAFVLSNAEDSETEYSSTVPDLRVSLSGGNSLFVLSSEEAVDSEIENESDTNDSSGDGSLEFFLSNEENQSQTEEFSNKNLNEDFSITLVPITEESAEAFIEEDSDSESFVTRATFKSQEETALNEKPVYMTTIDKLLNGAATFIIKTTTENEEGGIKTETFSTEDSTVEVTVTPLTTTDDNSEDYTLVSDYDSDKETSDIRSTAEDDSDAETIEVLSTTPYDDSDVISIEDSDEETSDIRSTAEDDSDAETIEALSTTPYDDSDGISIEDSDEESMVTEKYESDKATSPEDQSSEDEMIELVKILRDAVENYDTENSEKSELEEFRDSELEDSKSTEQFANNADHMSTAPDVSTSLVNGKVDFFSKWITYSEWISKDVQSRAMQPVYSHLDAVMGVPGEDYPNYTNIAATSFTCEGKESPGFYADLETRCQVFHVCWPLRREIYLCPVGSTFNQRILSCDYWFNSTCSLSPDYYEINKRLRDYPEQVVDGLYENFDENDIYPYNFRADHSHPIFNEMKFLPFLYKIINYSTKRRGLESREEIDYNTKVEIEFDKNSTLPTSEDLARQETSADSIDSTGERFRELLRSFIAAGISKDEESSDDEDSPLHKRKLQQRKYVYEKMLGSKFDRSGNVPDIKGKESSDETTSPKPEEVLHKNKQSKIGKEQIAPAIVFKVLETAENVVNKGILPLTRDMLAANYIKLYKKKKL